MGGGSKKHSVTLGFHFLFNRAHVSGLFQCKPGGGGKGGNEDGTLPSCLYKPCYHPLIYWLNFYFVYNYDP